MCQGLSVSRSGYYAWSTRPPGRLGQQDEELSEQLRTIHQDSDGRYGSPRIHLELQVQGVRCGKKRVARLMQEQQPSACQPRRFIATTDSSHALPVAPNTLNRQYQVETVVGLNQVWAEDITYIPTAGAGCTWLWFSATRWNRP